MTTTDWNPILRGEFDQPDTVGIIFDDLFSHLQHKTGFARSAGNRMFFMEGGKIIEDGPIRQLFSNPREKRTGEFLHKLEELYGKEG